MDNDNWTPVPEPQRPGVVVNLVSYPSALAGLVGDHAAALLGEVLDGMHHMGLLPAPDQPRLDWVRIMDRLTMLLEARLEPDRADLPEYREGLIQLIAIALAALMSHDNQDVKEAGYASD